MAKTNYYYCSRCEEITRHIEISHRELAAIKGENKLAQFICAFNDGLLATPWTAAYQAPPSTGFSRREYWSGVPSLLGLK